MLIDGNLIITCSMCKTELRNKMNAWHWWCNRIEPSTRYTWKYTDDKHCFMMMRIQFLIYFPIYNIASKHPIILVKGVLVLAQALLLEVSLPDGGGDHGLEFGLSSIHRNQEEDVMQGRGSGHSLCVVFVVYSEVCVGGITSPTHRQIQRSGLDPFSWHLRHRDTRQRDEKCGWWID